MKGVEFDFEDVAREANVVIQSLSLPVAKAATLAIKDASNVLRLRARSMIRSAGFSTKWEYAYRVTVYPQTGYSVDAAAFGLFKGIPYSDIFGLGGRIAGSPLLWLPLKTTPKLDRRKTAADVHDYLKKGVTLVKITGRSGTPLLAETILMSKAQARRKIVRLAAGDVLEGSKRLKGKRHAPGMVRRTVPLFHGVPSVTIRRRFDWAAMQAEVQAQVPGLYAQAIQRLADE